MEQHPGMFPWDGTWLAYFDHPYNHTAQNMRRVEIPIVRYHIEKFKQGRERLRMLEVGNVLSHYQEIDWPVVDLEEPGCINIDVMEYEPDEPVDFLVSISTVEHVSGEPNDVLDKLRSFLVPTGQAVITVPTQYNRHLDRRLRDGVLTADCAIAMRYIGNDEWGHCSLEEALASGRRSCHDRWCGGLVCLYLLSGTPSGMLGRQKE